MGLQGPFPTSVEIKTEEEGWALLAALAQLQRKYPQDHKRYSQLGELYATVLMACGDD